STNSLDKLPINFEGDVYPLHELAQISKKDAKRLIIDCSSFPGLVSPAQADGDRLFVPIPKVTREYREQLSKGAKASFLKAKEGFRRIQNKYISAAQNVAMSPECRVPKDKQHMVEEIFAPGRDSKDKARRNPGEVGWKDNIPTLDIIIQRTIHWI
ncbi:Ribosome recycling factor_ mitochondrial, partial [Caligus rogercresseyi]